jgi:hypothetical protein
VFQLKAESTDEHTEAVLFEGHSSTTSSTQTGELQCILVFNEKLELFELQKVDHQLRTTSFETKIRQVPPPKRPLVRHEEVRNVTTPPTTTTGSSTTTSTSTTAAPLPKKRVKTEASVFAPKARPKTPLGSNPKLKRATSVTSSDDEAPLAKLSASSPKNWSSKPSAPSPLNPVCGTKEDVSPERKKLYQPAAVLSRPPKQQQQDLLTRANTPKITVEKRATTPLSSVASPLISISSSDQASSSSRPLTASKKQQAAAAVPSSTIATPIIEQTLTFDDEDEFGALADELEEELLSDDGLFTIEERNPTTTTAAASSSSSSSTGNSNNSISLKSNVSGPISFRSLAGVTNDDEDEDVSSSEEE